MDKDEIIEMARQAGMYQDLNVSFNQSIQNFAKLVEAHTRGTILKPDWNNYRKGLIDGTVYERETCAKLFELYWNDAGLQRTYSPTEYINTVRERGEA